MGDDARQEAIDYWCCESRDLEIGLRMSFFRKHCQLSSIAPFFLIRSAVSCLPIPPPLLPLPLPPPPPAALAYVFEHEGEVSPECTLLELKEMHDSGELTGETMVWTEDLGDW